MGDLRPNANLQVKRQHHNAPPPNAHAIYLSSTQGPKLASNRKHAGSEPQGISLWIDDLALKFLAVHVTCYLRPLCILIGWISLSTKAYA